MKLNTKYDIGDRVFIEELNIRGYVDSMDIDRAGIRYYVKYFFGGDFKGSYFPEEVLQKINSEIYPRSPVGYMCNPANSGDNKNG